MRLVLVKSQLQSALPGLNIAVALERILAALQLARAVTFLIFRLFLCLYLHHASSSQRLVQSKTQKEQKYYETYRIRGLERNLNPIADS